MRVPSGRFPFSFLLSGIPLARLYSSTGKVHTWIGTYNFWWKRCARARLLLLDTQRYCDIGICGKHGFCGLAPIVRGVCAVPTRMVPVHDPCGWSVMAGGRLYVWLCLVSIRFEAHYWTVTSLVIGIGVLWLTSLAIFLAVFILPPEAREWKWQI